MLSRWSGGPLVASILLPAACGAAPPPAAEARAMGDSGGPEVAAPPYAGRDSGDALSPAAPLSPLQLRIDPSFASGGLSGHLSAWTPAGVAVDPQGRVLVSGPSSDPSSPPGQIIRRFASDGTLDMTFGISGHTSLPVGANQWAQAARGYADGRIGILGAASVDGGEGAFAARLDADGSLDPTFGGQPLLVTSGGRFLAGLWQEGGGGFILGAGALLHFDATGALDAAYGTSGSLPAAMAGSLGADGRLWTGAESRVSRYLSAGVPDASLGQAGAVELSWGDAGGGPPAIQSLLVGESGDAVVVGAHASGGSDYIDVARVSASGAPDAEFASGGAVTVKTSGGPVGVGELADNRIIVWTAGGDLVALLPDGSVQGSWSLEVLGTVLTAVLDASQRLVVAGAMTSDPAGPLHSEWFVRRYNLL